MEKIYFLCKKCTTSEGRGFFYIARCNQHPMVMGLSSIHFWKNKFFYVKNSSFESCRILVPWNNKKCLSNDMLEGYRRDAQDVEMLTKYRFELLVGKTGLSH